MVRKKNPEQTRQQILEVTADLIHRHGFKGMRVDEVVEKTGLTKGAIYHHFPNKQALGYAVVDELLHQMFIEHWNELLSRSEDPLDAVAQSFTCAGEDICEEDLKIGCPISNLGQEMSFEDEGFRMRINSVFDNWSNQIADLLRKGIEDGSVRPDIDPLKTARFLVSSFQGIQASSKCTPDIDRFHDNVGFLQEIIGGLKTEKPTSQTPSIAAV